MTHFYKHFSLIMSKFSRYQSFVAGSGNFGGKVPVVEDVFLSHEQKIYPTLALDENCMEFKLQTDRSYYVGSSWTYLALKLKFVKGRGNENYNIKELKKEQKEEAKADVEAAVADENEEVCFSRYWCKQHFAFHFYRCWSVHLYIEGLQLQWFACV